MAGPDSERGELATYRRYLRLYRRTLERQCEELTPEELATRSVPPSSLSLLGLVRHMTYVEHTWFQRALQANTSEPRPFTGAEDPDLDFNDVHGTAQAEVEALAAWRHEISRADAWLDTQSDATLGEIVDYNRHHHTMEVRDILVHMIEEYARHCGHADLIRERIDGRTGL